MKMNDYISNFTKHLTEALEIGQTILLSDLIPIFITFLFVD